MNVNEPKLWGGYTVTEYRRKRAVFVTFSRVFCRQNGHFGQFTSVFQACFLNIFKKNSSTKKTQANFQRKTEKWSQNLDKNCKKFPINSKFCLKNSKISEKTQCIGTSEYTCVPHWCSKDKPDIYANHSKHMSKSTTTCALQVHFEKLVATLLSLIDDTGAISVTGST